jgi:altronate hydrolase
MAGIVEHPCVAGYVVLSLGCEVNQPTDMIEATGMGNGHKPLVLTIQQDGGFRETVRRGIAAVERLLPLANEAVREEVPVSELVVALQCGGSDAWSGVTANPALGLAADEIVRQGGTVVLGETTEVYGGEHLLTRRAKSPEVAEKLLERIHWWERHTAMHGAAIDNNPAPGNKLGGLTTIYEKSLGAIAKAGNTPLTQVVDYAQRITERGFVHMDTPGYDPVSVTGQVAGGCNVVVFTTGRGSCFGFKPAPSIKIATNSTLYAAQEEDMDVNAGSAVEGGSLEALGREIFEEIVAVASGKRTKSELAGIGEEEFNPWIIGAML